MFYNALGYGHESLLERWSYSARECYRIGCNCSKCRIKEFRELKIKCQMKQYVLELVKKFGAPKDEAEYTEFQL